MRGAARPGSRAADGVEDGGADAAGGGKLGASLVDYYDRGSCQLINRDKDFTSAFGLLINNLTIFIKVSCSGSGFLSSLCCSYSNRSSQFIVSIGSCSLSHAVSTGLNALDNDQSIIGCSQAVSQSLTSFSASIDVSTVSICSFLINPATK